MADLVLVKGDFPLNIKKLPDDWYWVTCDKIPGLCLAGQNLEKIIDESKIVGPILLYHNKRFIRRD